MILYSNTVAWLFGILPKYRSNDCPCHHCTCLCHRRKGTTKGFITKSSIWAWQMRDCKAGDNSQLMGRSLPGARGPWGRCGVCGNWSFLGRCCENILSCVYNFCLQKKERSHFYMRRGRNFWPPTVANSSNSNSSNSNNVMDNLLTSCDSSPCDAST